MQEELERLCCLYFLLHFYKPIILPRVLTDHFKIQVNPIKDVVLQNRYCSELMKILPVVRSINNGRTLANSSYFPSVSLLTSILEQSD